MVAAPSLPKDSSREQRFLLHNVSWRDYVIRSAAKQRGAEPDECWVRDKELEEGEFPQIVLEVIETSPLLDKLAVYDGFGVDEVWIFEDGAFAIHQRRKNGGYVAVTKSALLPEIDFALLTRLSAERDQQTALEALERALHGARAKPKRRSR